MPSTSGWRPRRAAALILGVVLTACGSGARPRTDVPEPAAAPAADAPPAGRVVPLPGEPEGLVWDDVTGTIAVAVRNPGGVVLVDGASLAERTRVPLQGAARHLQLAGPGGPVLVPAESNDRLYQVALSTGAVEADVPVGRQPHDAAAVGAGVLVGDELADTVHVVRPGGSATVVPAPVQPGGVAASPGGAVAVVVGVRGRRIAAYAPDGRRLGEAGCGVGPTHVRAGTEGVFYVADTQGGALLVFRAGPGGVRQVGRVSTGGGAPYGLAVDVARSRVVVTLTGTNELRSYRSAGERLVPERTWRTVRQPNDVAVDRATGRIVVAGTAEGLLQVVEPPG